MMDLYLAEDTICAISTPGGTGGIAVIRVSGPEAVSIVDSLWKGAPLSSAKSHTAHLGEIIDKERSDEPLDQCVATVFRRPNSYTGEDIVEISVHGSRWIQRETIALLIRSGCRMAQPGEYTRRAVMNGRMDLSQAEGVADVIASSSRAAHRIAMSQMKGSISKKLSTLREQLIQLSALLELELDFSEEDVEFADRNRLLQIATDIHNELQRLHNSFQGGNAIKEGIPVAIIGATNAGKSSLLNTLLDEERAIVSDIHGTTRDTIEETLEIGDYLFRFIDTAGLRDTSDPIEQIGISRSRKAISRSVIALLLIDATTVPDDSLDMTTLRNHLPAELLSDTGISPSIIVVLNKVDLLDPSSKTKQAINTDKISIEDVISISAKHGTGISCLKHALTKIAKNKDTTDQNDIIITNLRQAEALGQAIESIRPLINGLNNGLESFLIAEHLRETISHLSTITGTIPSTEILNTIFSQFCIGK